jgi:hypothetical protein
MFVFAYLGSKKPVLRMIPVLLFINMTGISNTQVYSFMGLVTGGMVITLTLVIIWVVDMLWTTSRPERVFLQSLQRFFRGCARMTAGFALMRPRERKAGRRLRKRFFESMVLPAPRQLQATGKQLDHKLFPDNTPEKVDHLLAGIQSVAIRMQALEIAHQRVLRHRFERAEPLGELGAQLRERLHHVFEQWSRGRNAEALDQERVSLEQIWKDLEQHLESKGQAGPKQASNEASRDLYSLLGTLRGLVRAMARTQDAVQTINWRQWDAARF